MTFISFRLTNMFDYLQKIMIYLKSWIQKFTRKSFELTKIQDRKSDKYSTLKAQLICNLFAKDRKECAINYENGFFLRIYLNIILIKKC